jgi:hypothetical protein
MVSREKKEVSFMFHWNLSTASASTAPAVSQAGLDGGSAACGLFLKVNFKMTQESKDRCLTDLELPLRQAIIDDTDYGSIRMDRYRACLAQTRWPTPRLVRLSRDNEH